MLTGSELLATVKSMDHCSKSELVRACGYVSIKADGSERLNFTAFYEALLEAKGMSVGMPVRSGKATRGRRLSYTTKVQFNGNLMIGKAYTAMLDFKPGDEFQIKLGRKQIVLSAINVSSSDSEPAPADSETSSSPEVAASCDPTAAPSPTAELEASAACSMAYA